MKSAEQSITWPPEIRALEVVHHVHRDTVGYVHLSLGNIATIRLRIVQGPHGLRAYLPSTRDRQLGRLRFVSFGSFDDEIRAAAVRAFSALGTQE